MNISTSLDQSYISKLNLFIPPIKALGAQYNKGCNELITLLKTVNNIINNSPLSVEENTKIVKLWGPIIAVRMNYGVGQSTRNIFNNIIAKNFPHLNSGLTPNITTFFKNISYPLTRFLKKIDNSLYQAPLPIVNSTTTRFGMLKTPADMFIDFITNVFPYILNIPNINPEKRKQIIANIAKELGSTINLWAVTQKPQVQNVSSTANSQLKVYNTFTFITPKTNTSLPKSTPFSSLALSTTKSPQLAMENTNITTNKNVTRNRRDFNDISKNRSSYLSTTTSESFNTTDKIPFFLSAALILGLLLYIIKLSWPHNNPKDTSKSKPPSNITNLQIIHQEKLNLLPL